MTSQATLAHGLMLKNKWPTLCSVTLKTGLILAQERNAAALERLLHVCLCAFDSDPNVRIVAISTTDLALQNGMMMRQLKLCPHFQVTLETSLGGLARIDNRVRRTAALDMKTSRPVARFAPDVLCVLSFCHQPC